MAEQDQCSSLRVENSTELRQLRESLSNAVRIADYGGEPALDSEGNSASVKGELEFLMVPNTFLSYIVLRILDILGKLQKKIIFFSGLNSFWSSKKNSPKKYGH